MKTLVAVKAEQKTKIQKFKLKEPGNRVVRHRVRKQTLGSEYLQEEEECLACKFCWELSGQEKYLYSPKKMKVELLMTMHRDNKWKTNWQCVTRFSLLFSMCTLHILKKLMPLLPLSYQTGGQLGSAGWQSCNFVPASLIINCIWKEIGDSEKRTWAFWKQWIIAGFQNIPHKKMTICQQPAQKSPAFQEIYLSKQLSKDLTWANRLTHHRYVSLLF